MNKSRKNDMKAFEPECKAFGVEFTDVMNGVGEGVIACESRRGSHGSVIYRFSLSDVRKYADKLFGHGND